MKYLPLLTDDEIKYICSVIPPQEASIYFQRYPKESAKILPGFRPKTIAKYNAGGELLFRHRNRDFISSFIEKHINRWLSEIQECIEECIEDGNDKDSAYVQILSQSYFAENVTLYFKLTEDDYPETYISLLSSAVAEAKRATEKQDKLEAEVTSRDIEIKRLQSDIKSMKVSLKSSKAKQNEYIAEIKYLKQEMANTEDLYAIIRSKEGIITDLEAEVKVLKRSEKELKTKLSAAENSQQQLAIQIRNEIEKQKTEKLIEQITATKPLCPIDMDEFKEYLGYNLKDIGASIPSDSFLLLKQHLCNILFRGMPILINRGTGLPLMKCVANALVGDANIDSLIFRDDISLQELESFLSGDKRIICLDNFIGNYNETEMINLFERHRNKIIFLTFAYDRTLRYIPYEFFRYCHYLNLNRIQTLHTSTELTEDPSVIEEREVNTPEPNLDARYSSFLKEMLADFGLSQSLAANICARINNEEDLCCTLAFDTLPYCVDVLQIAPFAASERLAKYAGDMGRCSYKNLFKEWFAR
ncbi:hypothetical protein LJC56_09180 [Christensenellaceae bacterium OttesenSCG-928-K19]|nr:hypothetical protein [Christensenellaceae bacterium OttesenSCG-928-K19]